MSGPVYTWKWGPESAWIIVTATMVYVMQIAATDFENIVDWRKFLISAGAGLVRAVIGALLASRSGGFRPEVPTGPVTPTVDEEIGTSPRAVRRPNLPDDADKP